MKEIVGTTIRVQFEFEILMFLSKSTKGVRMYKVLWTLVHCSQNLKTGVMATKVTKFTLLGFSLLGLWFLKYKLFLLFMDHEPKCEKGQLYQECSEGCSKDKLLYVGDKENCSHPGYVCCDQIGSAYCSSQGLCSCNPGYEPRSLKHFSRFKVTCYVSGGQPCPGRYGYHSMNHDKLYKLLSNNYSVPQSRELTLDEKKVHQMRTALRKQIIDKGYYKTLLGWGCESGICNDYHGICEYGVNPHFD